jgi:hypothetical protein
MLLDAIYRDVTDIAVLSFEPGEDIIECVSNLLCIDKLSSCD